MKIDIFPHIMPVKYKEAFYKEAPPNFYHKELTEAIPTLFDLESRFRIMDNDLFLDSGVDHEKPCIL